jgi:hypothetical protein
MEVSAMQGLDELFDGVFERRGRKGGRDENERWEGKDYREVIDRPEDIDRRESTVQGRPQQAQRWEYCTMRYPTDGEPSEHRGGVLGTSTHFHHLDSALNDLGAAGWELVAVSEKDRRYTFKRPAR